MNGYLKSTNDYNENDINNENPNKLKILKKDTNKYKNINIYNDNDNDENENDINNENPDKLKNLKKDTNTNENYKNDKLEINIFSEIVDDIYKSNINNKLINDI